MAKRDRIRWGWFGAAVVALALTVVALGYRSGSCADGDLVNTCSSIDATSTPVLGVVLVGLAVTVGCSVKAFRGGRR
ncbi:hypothetical protein [Demequina aurantiaca]|uniref:hypothetical protein n=1 Tax=Demequina aurantiaca TaxID=676200 RepID=UPI003D354A13